MHQDDHARQNARVLAQALQHDFGADEGLDAGATGRLVELDGAEQVVQVADAQRRLRIPRCRLHDLLDAVGTVDDGEFGVEAQVHEHGSIVGNARPLTFGQNAVP